MSFNIQDLQSRAETKIQSQLYKAYGFQKSAEDLIIENNKQILSESKISDSERYHIFLSHSSKDARLILGIVEEFKRFGYKVYVDWIEDPQMDRSNVNKHTANKLKSRMNESMCLLYATTENSSSSKWMPWELGFMDGKKDKAAILPVFQSSDYSSHTFKGQEYLGIYPYCIKGNYKFFPNKEGLWILDDADTYVTFDDWLKGKKPKKQ
jgi:hypothetical protein